MIWYLFENIEFLSGMPGAGLVNYISFRSAMAVIASLLLSLIIGRKIINYLQRRQMGEMVRDLDLEGKYRKEGTPTMGGIIILISIVVPVLLFARLDNVYIILMLATTIWLGFIGFCDDYIKVIAKNKDGLPARYKILGQVVIGLIVGVTLYFSDQAVVREPVPGGTQPHPEEIVYLNGTDEEPEVRYRDVKSTKSTIPFVKNNEFNYEWLVFFIRGESRELWAWVVFVVMVIFIVSAVSNGANLTDGLDGLATGTSAIIGSTLGILAYVSGNVIYADYLNIMYIPNSGELVIFASAFIGAAIGFLWYNSYPAQVFMGDTGSLSLGGIIAVMAIIIRKELLIPVLCGIFFAESVSVMIQVAWFKHTRRRFGVGRRVFLMAPLHHHYQKKGYPESKIVIRFWIVAIILAVISVVTLKVR